MPRRLAKRPAGTAAEWMRLWARTARGRYVKNPPDKGLARLAGLTAVVGAPGNPVAVRAFHALAALFLRGDRVPRWHPAIDAIEPTPRGVLHIVWCVEAHGKHADANELARARIRLDRVVGTMARCSDPDAYVAHCARSNFTKPAALWHPNTLDAAKRRVRGRMGALAGQRQDLDDIEVV